MKDELENIHYELDMAKAYINDAVSDARSLAAHETGFEALLSEIKDIFFSIDSALDEVQEKIDELDESKEEEK